MPLKSKAQMRWMFANKPEMAKEWASKTPSIAKLPERVGDDPRSSHPFRAMPSRPRICATCGWPKSIHGVNDASFGTTVGSAF